MLLALALLTVVSGADATAATLPGALAAPGCVACQVDDDPIRGAYSPGDWNTLTAGNVLTSDVTDGGAGEAEAGTVRATGIVLRPPSDVWTTLVDFASRPRFQPGTKDVHVVRVDGNRVWVTEHLRFFLVDVRFTVINTLDPARGTIRWVMDESAEHDIGGTSGSWQLTPLTARHHTLLTYRAWIDTGRHVPAFIERFLLHRSLPNVIAGLRDEVERRSREP